MAKLAINGGNGTRTEMIQPWPVTGEKEIQAVEKVLKSGHWGTLGPEVKKFEERFSAYQHTKHGLCITSGTTTLEVALRALDIGYGDEVIVPPYTFYATASSVIMVSATPVFADIEYDTYNIDADRIEEAITKRTKAVICVHIGGRSCNMDKIMSVAKKHGIHVIEDCAHSHGSEWKGRRVGSIGDVGSFSFQNSKNLTSGEGGCLTTNDTELYKMMWSIHTCGRNFDDTGWYVHTNVATNARMTEFQAAVLNVRLDMLDEQIRNREENAAYLNSMLEQIPCVRPLPADPRITRNSYHLFIFKYFKEKCKGLPRETFIKALIKEGVTLCSYGYNCLYKQPVFSGDKIRKLTGTKIDYASMDLKNTEKAVSEESVWLVQSMLLGNKKGIEQIAESIMKIYSNVDELL
jgi:dTDP-4-amino-4,6-dideoxygalactose transaminase